MISVWENPRFTVRPFVRRLEAVVVFLCLLVAVSVQAAETRNFADLSIEELLNESVTSVSKREQKLRDAAAAIAVFSNDDLRRSGALHIADALRLVPGMNVASASASQWSVSARGFNNLYANKLLVLVDGRAVYTPLFAGVYWDQQQSMMEDIDRVEVIRGPGATVWGANAVNGVVNVVTRSARDTQGELMYAGYGDGDMSFAGVRHGGAKGEKTYYRVFGSFQRTAPFLLPNGDEANDGWDAWYGGARVDHYPDDLSQVTFQSDVSATETDNGLTHGYNFNTLGRWTRDFASGGNVEAQIYYDRSHQDETSRARWTIDTIDFSLQQTFDIGLRHKFIWGSGYRLNDASVAQTNPTALIRKDGFTLNLYNAFLQDEFQLVPDRLILTAGLKLEHNDFTGIETQPSVRAVWKPSESQTVWAAVSRAVRTPSVAEGYDLFSLVYGAPTIGPGGGLYLPTIVGNADPRSEVVHAYEVGWRAQVSRRVSFDLATFYNRYKRVILLSETPRFVPGTPLGFMELPFDNAPGPDTHGGELSVTLTPIDQWRLTFAQSLLIVSQADSSRAIDDNPEHQTIVRSSYDFGTKVSLDLQWRYVGEYGVSLAQAGQTVPAYAEADARLSYRPTDGFEMSLVGQNLLDRQHPEQGAILTAAIAEVPRRFYAKVTLRF